MSTRHPSGRDAYACPAARLAGRRIKNIGYRGIRVEEVAALRVDVFEDVLGVEGVQHGERRGRGEGVAAEGAPVRARRQGVRELLPHEKRPDGNAPARALGDRRHVGRDALVLHGERDTLIPPSEAELTFGALGTRVKERVLIPGRGHNDVSDHPLYWEALARFITRLAGRPQG